ncbi:MAG: methionyl-tRNA formyltransferase [Proteobacteria bacterium]|nr:methionyl-tRNA formyltransferase [Pseudomonadota bacterium]
MRIVFAGTPLFAGQALAALIAAGHEIKLVLTQPDRPAGRGMRMSMSPVKQLAVRQGLDVYQPPNLRDPESLERLQGVSPDVLVVAAYGLILPQRVLDVARKGAVNIHASLLPRWRGAAPIQRAILAGDRETGVTIMQMDAGLDTGAMLSQRRIPILAEDTASTLHDRLAALGAEMIVEALRDCEKGVLRAVPQPAEGVTYAHKIDKGEAALDWRKANAELDRQVRAFNPFPGALAVLGDAAVKVWRARPVAGHGDPGEILSTGDDGVVVACGAGALALAELQRAGAKRLGARDFLRGHPLEPGSRFALPD